MKDTVLGRPAPRWSDCWYLHLEYHDGGAGKHDIATLIHAGCGRGQCLEKLPSGGTASPTFAQKISHGDFQRNSLGAGYSLVSIMATFTDAPVSTGIRKRLSWIDDYDRRDARLNGSTSVAIATNDLADNLGAGAFSVGITE